MKTIVSLIAALLSGGLIADVPQALTYRGVLTRTGGYDRATALELTFRLYDSRNPVKALWARTMRVPVDTNGVFYAELKDTNGTDPDSIGFSLGDAMGKIKGTPEVGLTPPDAPELKPRQQLKTSVRAARAVRTKAADVALAPAGVYAQGVDIDTAVLEGVTVWPGAKFAAFPNKCTLTQMKARDIGGGASSVTVRDIRAARPNWPVSFDPSSFKYTTESAPCDMILTYEGEDGAFNVIVPAGGKIVDGDSSVQTVCGTAFGNP